MISQEERQKLNDEVKQLRADGKVKEVNCRICEDDGDYKGAVKIIKSNPDICMLTILPISFFGKKYKEVYSTVDDVEVKERLRNVLLENFCVKKEE